tara:strand:- start:184 stop:1503 length:1320 start_codon:yes stop_codon:yes gene_type:complete
MSVKQNGVIKVKPAHSIYPNIPDDVVKNKEGIRSSVKKWFNVENIDDRLLKYYEILLHGKNATPYSDIDTMSFRGIVIAITAKCNAHCFACYRYDSVYKSVLETEMPWEKLKQIVNNTKGKFKFVHLAGLGEVWFYPRLYDAIRLVRKISDNVKITTNASFLSKERIDSVINSGLTEVEVSIWQFDEKKERKYRGLDLKKEIADVIYMANETNLKVQVNILVASYNYKDLFSLVDDLKDAKGLIIHTIPLFETETARKQNITRVSTADWDKLVRSWESDIKKYNLDWTMTKSGGEVAHDPVIEMKKNQNICFTTFEDPYINEIGYLLPCVRMKPEFSGNIPIPHVDASPGFENVWHHPALVEFRRNMLSGDYPPLCGEICYVKSQMIKSDEKHLDDKWPVSVELRKSQEDVYATVPPNKKSGPTHKTVTQPELQIPSQT